MSEPSDSRARPFVSSAGELAVNSSSLAVLLDGVLGKGASLRFTAQGYSMAPFIRHGDVLTIAPLDRSRPGIGDVVGYVPSNGSRLIVHRIVGKRRGAFLVAGDARSEGAVAVGPEDIVGRVVKVEREGEDVVFGLGLERKCIALLGRSRLLWSFVLPVWRGLRSARKRWRA